MKPLASYVGRLARVRQEILSRLDPCRTDATDNRFPVVAVHRRRQRLVCYGGRHRLLLRAEDVCLL